MQDTVSNKSLAVFLLNVPGLRAVTVTYEGLDENKKPKDKPVLYKTVEKDLAVGDLVIVPTHTRCGFTCVQVAELDVEPDLESTSPVGWIVGKFNTSGYAVMLDKERQVIDAIREADKRARQEELRKRLLGNVDPNNLPTIDLTPLPPPPPKE